MEPINAARPRKSVMGGGTLGYNEKVREWQNNQDASAPETEVIELFLHNSGVENMTFLFIPSSGLSGVPNNPILFTPNPEAVQEPTRLMPPSIWDKVVDPNTTPLPPEVIPLPTLAETAENVPKQFNPDPNAVQKPSQTVSVSIWEYVVDPNNREREGAPVRVSGGRIDLDNIDWPEVVSCNIILPGGEELHVEKSSAGGKASSRKTSGMLANALGPYRSNPEFFSTVEGPLLVSLYWLRQKGISVSEVRLIREGN